MAFKLTPLTQATHKGRRPYQEDRFFSLTTPTGLCFGVFDGHGGMYCAEKAVEIFPPMMEKALMENRSIIDSFLDVFVKLDTALAIYSSGTTASIAFIPTAANRVYVAVLGDSPVIVQRAGGSIWIAPEHNIKTNKTEADVAIAKGGKISEDGYLCLTNYGAGLQMSRSLGDKDLDQVLNRTPEIFEEELGVGSFVLVCTDGALDPGHNALEVATQGVLLLIQAGGNAEGIVKRAVAIPTGDNATAMLVRVVAAS